MDKQDIIWFQKRTESKRCLVNLWELWCKAIGGKAYDEDNNRSDWVAIIPTGWVVLHIPTCPFYYLQEMVDY